MADTAICPDGIRRRKIWHLFRPEPLEFDAVCGKVFAGAINPNCFTEQWERVNCSECQKIMMKGLSIRSD